MIARFTNNDATRWRVVGYFTDKYENEAEQMVGSMLPLRFSYSVFHVEDRGSWDKNTHYKAEFVKWCLDNFKEDIVYLDVDARVEQYPGLFDLIAEYDYGDLSYHVLGRNEFLSGTVFFKNNEVTKQVVDKWVESCKQNFEINEQWKLGEVIKKCPEVRSYILPFEYCAIFDHPNINGTCPIIKHLQASRKYRR